MTTAKKTATKKPVAKKASVSKKQDVYFICNEDNDGMEGPYTKDEALLAIKELAEDDYQMYLLKFEEAYTTKTIVEPTIPKFKD